ncbi:threonine/serine exporter family protein [Virgibacillus xinjiangensis]|uniref:Threonine/serine exporter family protein n=1 Tax=Virgibacillus xinjiangensis TaxID=393090 RepID=A0ABV7CV76_9BACI
MNNQPEKVCMLAGKIMLESGAETHRVEDTMNRMAAACGLENAHSLAMPTGIYFSSGAAEITNFMRITSRSTADLDTIDQVNTVSRQLTAGELDINAAASRLKKIDQHRVHYKEWVQIVAAAFVSGSFTIMFGGTWPDFLPAFLAGGGGYAGMLAFNRFLDISFLSEFFGSFVLGLLAVIFVNTGFGVHLDDIIIGAVMPLVPGLHITNATRDLLAGHLVAGLSKGVEAMITAFAIGAGVAVVVGFI